MGVSSTTNRVAYTGDGVSTAFPFGFYFFSPSDLKVFLYDTLLGGITPLVLNTDYTVTGTPSLQGLYPMGGTVNISASAPPTTTIVVIDRNPIPLQNFALINNGQISSSALVQQLDYLTLLIQSLQDQVSRCIQMPLGLGATFNPVLPSAMVLAPNFLSYLQINSLGNGMTLSTLPATAGVVNTFNLTNGGAGAITGMIFASANFSSVRIVYDILYEANTPTTVYKEEGVISITYDPTNGWRLLNGNVQFDDANVAFSVNSVTGQVSYNSATNPGTATTFEMNWSIESAI